MESVAGVSEAGLRELLFQNYPENESHTLKPKYPEVLLQETENANRYYSSFQRYTQQFVNQDRQNAIVRWTDSSIENIQRLIVGSWSGSDKNRTVDVKPTSKGDKRRGASQRSAANALFAWSSSDAYIQARKRELAIKRGEIDPVEETKEIKTASPTTANFSKNAIKIHTPKESVSNRLNRVVEIESNRFIHARIQVIRAHHSEEINKQIHERKRKDHELHLQKLKLKEEEYEKEMKAATEQSKQGGFFNNLFGFNTTANGEEQPPVSGEISRPETPTPGASASKHTKSKRFSFLPGKTKSASSPKPEDNAVLFDAERPATPLGNVTPIPQSQDKEEEDDDSDFEDFSSSGPVNTPVETPARPVVQHQTSHRFIPVGTPVKNPVSEKDQINSDLLDIFGPSQTTSPAPQIQPKPAVSSPPYEGEDLLQL